MKVGEYVRYRKLDFNNKNNIRIAKIIDIQEESGYHDENGNPIKFLFFDNGNGEYEDRIIKSSPNIMNLIEVGDYVNGWKITTIDKRNNKLYAEYDDGYLIQTISKKNIKSIVTKEQFESMQYKVGE